MSADQSLSTSPKPGDPGSSDVGDPPSDIGGRYSKYVLAVLVLVYVFNFVDRQILSILAEDLKADLGLNDSQIGFLYGTAFAVFYAIFGIPLGKLADVWVRKSLISTGLAFWSLMTALSGTARSFGSLATYRIGVGVGEASASPAAFSMLSDYFPPRLRATAFAIYSSGVYIGAGLGILLGGQVVDRWNKAFADGGAPFGLAGWQAAFFVVGIPGILMSLWVWQLREPRRGQADGIFTEKHPAPFRAFGRELLGVVPPLTLVSLAMARGGSKVLVANFAAAAAIAVAAWGLTVAIGNPVQWIALGIGVYCAVSWAQGLALRDKPSFALIFGSRGMIFGVSGFASISFVTYALGFWTPPYIIRAHQASASEAGLVLGISAAVAGFAGVTFGGVLSDAFKRRWPHGRFFVGYLAIAIAVPTALGFLYARSLWLAYVFSFLFNVGSSMWIGSAATTPNDLVLPRMRGTASAFYLLMVTFIGLALGPFTVGRLSDAFARADDASAGLRGAMAASLLMFVISALLLWLGSRSVGADESSRVERARAAGEVV